LDSTAEIAIDTTADAASLIERLADTDNLYEQIELLAALARIQGVDGVISMRGDFGEGNQGQIPMGRATPKVLEAMDFVVLTVDSEADVIKTARAGAIMAFNGEKAVALLLSQKLKGAKAFPSGDGE
jgi:sulfopyruvate decarboxylase TPP-binding subunit